MRRIKATYVLLGALLLLIGVVLSGYRSEIPLKTVVDRYKTPQSHWIKLDGSNIHFTDRGEGPVLLMIHGSGSEQGAFTGIAEQLSLHGFRAIAIDLPGSGLSEAGPNTKFTMPDNVRLVGDFIDALEVAPAAVVGHSTGGQIAWTLALDRPELTDRLVLIAPTGMPVESPLTWRMAKIPVIGQLSRWITPTWVIRANLHEAFFDDSKVTNALVERYRAMILRAGARDALFQRMRAVTFARHDELPCLRSSVLLLWGSKDIWLPPALASQFTNAIASSKLMLFESVGHDLPKEADPAKVARVITSWIAKPEPAKLRSASCPQEMAK